MPLRLRRERWVYSSRLWSYRTSTIFRRSSQPSRRAGRRDSYSCLLHHFGSAGARLGDLVLKARLPAISAFRDLAIAGLLMTYGPNVEELFGRSAAFVAKILKGQKPGDIPVERPSRFDLVVNLKTAKALQQTIPQSLLARADELIQ